MLTRTMLIPFQREEERREEKKEERKRGRERRKKGVGEGVGAEGKERKDLREILV